MFSQRKVHISRMLWVLWTGAAGALLILLLYSRSRRLARRLVVLTGGDSGAGLLIARELAKLGARVIIAGEDQSRGSEAAGLLTRTTGGNVQYRHLDLASFRSVRKFAADFASSERRLDILINNAAVTQLENSLTEDGVVQEMQINHFAPFLLTNLLLPQLQAASQGRIVNASSVMHYLGRINTDTLIEKARDKHAHKRAFANSKLCNILFTRELSRRLQDSRVTANCFHPGLVNREVEETPYTNFLSIIKCLLKFVCPDKTPDEATTAVFLAANPTLSGVSGKYYVDCKETKPSKAAMDDGLAEKLWEVSENVVNNKCTNL